MGLEVSGQTPPCIVYSVFSLLRVIEPLRGREGWGVEFSQLSWLHHPSGVAIFSSSSSSCSCMAAVEQCWPRMMLIRV